MRISVWSSDVCASDLNLHVVPSSLPGCNTSLRRKPQRKRRSRRRHPCPRLKRICRGRAHTNLTRQALNMRPDVHLPVGTPPPQRRSHLVLGCAHLVAVAGGVTSQLTQIWPLASDRKSTRLNSSH